MADANDLNIEIFGSEVLRTPCSAVTKFDRKLEKFAKKMLKKMYESQGVGLAAPQVGVKKRLMVIDVDWSPERYKEIGDGDPNPFIMVNPVIVYKEGEMESFEGCLSFPEVFFNVTRAKRIVFKFQDLKGKEHRMEAEGDLFCRCIQHEIDHLDGKLFVDIANDKAIAMEELDKVGLGDIDSPPPIVL